MITLTYQYKLKVNRQQEREICSLVSEYIIPADEPYPNYFVQAKKVYPILKTVNAQVLQQVLKTLDKAFNQMKSKSFGF
ncbi:MAG: transposase, partial [Microcystis aeruginosa LL11-07]|nr:transposase [Microcystis aeruginosa LL11-07]